MAEHSAGGAAPGDGPLLPGGEAAVLDPTSTSPTPAPAVARALALTHREVRTIVPGRPSMRAAYLSTPPRPIDAAKKGSLQDLVTLAMMGEDLSRADSDGNTPLHWAASKDNIEVLSFLLHLFPTQIEVVNGLGQTPLMWAASFGNMASSLYLLERGANINAADYKGNSVLLNAVQNGHLWLTHYYVTHGADRDQTDNDGHTPLCWAAYGGNLSLAQYFVQRWQSNVRVTDRLGRTHLHWAARKNHREICHYLLSLGCPLEARDNANLTAVEHAREQGHLELSKELAKLASKPFDENTPTHRSPFSLTVFQDNLHKGSVSSFMLPCAFFGSAIFLHWVPLLLLLGVGFAMVQKQISSISRKRGQPPGEMFVAWWLGSVASVAFMIGYWIAPYTPPAYSTEVMLLLTCMCLTVYFWMRALHLSPGVLPRGRDLDEMLARAQQGQIPSSDYCHTCKIRKPMRSKHCAQCGHCVARFDHHCIWINKDVGVENHAPFLAFVIFHTLFAAIWVHLVPSLIGVMAGEQLASMTWMESLGFGFHYYPTLAFSTIYLFLIGLWLSMLMLYQVRIVCFNLTTNEQINAARYPHFRTPDGRYRNPFDLGRTWKNIAEFLGYGPVRDWYSTYPPASASSANPAPGISPAAAQQHARQHGCRHHGSQCPHGADAV